MTYTAVYVIASVDWLGTVSGADTLSTTRI